MQQEKLYKSIKYRIFPTDLQKEMLKHWFGADRWIWNHLVKRVFNENYNSKDVNRFKLRDEILNNGPEFVNRKTRTHVSDLLIDASVHKFIMNYNLYKTTKHKLKLKSKSSKNKSCVLNKKNDNTVRFEDGYLNMTTTKFYGRQTFKSNRKFNMDQKYIKQIQFIKEYNDKYYICLIYEIDRKNNTSNKKIGIDMGLKTYLTCYDGNNSVIEFRKDIENLSNKINKKKSILSYHKKGSKRFKKCKKELLNLYKRLRNIKKDFIEKTTSYLVNNYNVINVDTFNFQFNSNVSHINKKKSILSPATFVLRLEQKAKEYNCKVNIIPAGTPTTQTCSSCGNVKSKDEKLTLNDRTYICNKCGYEEDRDINAAKNVFNYNS